jgi:hypothetical protein
MVIDKVRDAGCCQSLSARPEIFAKSACKAGFVKASCLAQHLSPRTDEIRAWPRATRFPFQPEGDACAQSGNAVTSACDC